MITEDFKFDVDDVPVKESDEDFSVYKDGVRYELAVPEGDHFTNPQECDVTFLGYGPALKLPEFKTKGWKLYVKWCKDKYYLRICYPKNISKRGEKIIKECQATGVAAALASIYVGAGAAAVKAFAIAFVGCLQTQAVLTGIDLVDEVSFTIYREGNDCGWHRL